jgi:hypothetical protein
MERTHSLGCARRRKTAAPEKGKCLFFDMPVFVAVMQGSRGID